MALTEDSETAVSVSKLGDRTVRDTEVTLSNLDLCMKQFYLVEYRRYKTYIPSIPPTAIPTTVLKISCQLNLLIMIKSNSFIDGVGRCSFSDSSH